MASDPEEHGRDLWERLNRGEFGPIGEYVTPLPDPARADTPRARTDMRTVAFLDVLGFKEKILNTPLDLLASNYESWASTLRTFLTPPLHDIPAGKMPTLFSNHVLGEPWCLHYLFSDSLILVSNADTDDSFLHLLVYVWRLMQVCLAIGMPLRGAIEHGEIYARPEKNVFLGQALTNAYLTEEKQQWMGATIGASAARRYPDLFAKIDDPNCWLNLICKTYSVPMKSSSWLNSICNTFSVPMKNRSPKEFRTVNWRFNFYVEQGIRSLFSPTKDKKARLKIENTMKYAKAVVDSGRAYSDQHKTPIELRPFFIGKAPFAHADDP
jgi:hypothetical protein